MVHPKFPNALDKIGHHQKFKKTIHFSSKYLIKKWGKRWRKWKKEQRKKKIEEKKLWIWLLNSTIIELFESAIDPIGKIMRDSRMTRRWEINTFFRTKRFDVRSDAVMKNYPRGATPGHLSFIGGWNKREREVEVIPRDKWEIPSAYALYFWCAHRLRTSWWHNGRKYCKAIVKQ